MVIRRSITEDKNFVVLIKQETMKIRCSLCYLGVISFKNSRSIYIDGNSMFICGVCFQ